MLGKVGRRAIDFGVLFLALYAFAFVPLGERTGLEHLQAVLATRAARDAGRELLTAAERLKRRLLGPASDAPIEARGAPVVPKLPKAQRAPENASIAPASAPERGADLTAVASPPHLHEGPDASQ